MNKNKKRGWFRGAEDERDDSSLESGHDAMDAVPGTAPSLATGPGPMISATGSEPAITLPPKNEAGAIDTVAIFESAGIPHADRERVERARTLLRALPHSATPAVKKQIVETALKTFGVSTEKIVEAAQRETGALESFITTNQVATDKLLEESRTRVLALEQEIANVKLAAQSSTAVQEKRIRLANAELIAVQQVLGFFGAGGGAPNVNVEFEEPTENRLDMHWAGQGLPPPRPGIDASAKTPERPKSASVPPRPRPLTDPTGGSGSH